MENESLEKLRLDKRLIGRRGWVAEDELKRALEALPDTSDKIAPLPVDDSDESSAPDESA